jgi:hypothetical protein
MVCSYIKEMQIFSLVYFCFWTIHRVDSGDFRFFIFMNSKGRVTRNSFVIYYTVTGQSNYCYIIEPRYFVTSFPYLSHFMNRFLVFLDRLLYYLIHPWCCGTLLVHWRTLLLPEESYCTTPKLWYCCVRGSYWDPIAALGTLLLHWGPYTSALKTLLLY